MVTINPKIFKTYDIRGNVTDELTPEVAVLIGKALGTYFQHICGQQQVVVGYDMRLSSLELFNGLTAGLTMTGCDVFNIGQVATPVLYHQAFVLGTAGVMITGSHLAKEFNGFKIVVGNKPVFGMDIQTLYDVIGTGLFEEGHGKIYVIDSINASYKEMLTASFRRGRSLKIVVDAGNGMGGIYAPTILRGLGHDITELYCEPNGNFPNHHPNPEKSENMQDLADKVKTLGADVGLAFDGDADRVGVVDEQGNHISADKILAWLATDILPRHPEGAVVVGDVLSSQVLFDTVEAYGGEPLIWASGHARIKAKMQAEGAVFGGESSGHMFFADRYAGFDDGIYAAGRVVELLASGAQPLSAHLARLPHMYTTPEYRPHCPDEKKRPILNMLRRKLRHEKIVDVDGLRVLFPNGWGLVRASGTEPVLSLRFEAYTEADALAYKKRLVELLRDLYPELPQF